MWLLILLGVILFLLLVGWFLQTPRGIDYPDHSLIVDRDLAEQDLERYYRFINENSK